MNLKTASFIPIVVCVLSAVVLCLLKLRIIPCVGWDIIILAIVSIAIGSFSVFSTFYLNEKLQKVQRQLDIRNAIKQVIWFLNNFATTWESVRNKERLNLQKDILPVLTMGTDIKWAITSIPTTITDVDFSEGLDIANRLESIKKSLDEVQPHDSFGSTQPVNPRDDIDKLAKRAKLFAAKLEGRNRKK